MPKPLLKWVGGKSKLLKRLFLYTPNDYTNYVEPFIGGGALLFSLNPPSGVINDANSELINFYMQTRDNPLELLNLTKTIDISEETYYNIRNYDKEENWCDKKSCLFRAARFLYLNRTAFNGMWRSNSKGGMNTPYGKYITVNFPSPDHMIKISKLLRRLVILNIDFYETINYVNTNTFVYLDPPYIPYSDTANFANYTSVRFGVKDQERLVGYCNEVNKKGAKFLLSNSDTPLTRVLFKDFIIEAVDVYHSVGALAKSRKDKGEVLISNYENELFK
ncbi:Dam family site-specific DNA-(adenine-N6)-methyltransferase [bacterium]|nr:Dam family site-specific DNA-(adenine-N6)-methyltransferase [bacterium]